MGEHILVRKAAAEDAPYIYRFICMLEDQWFDESLFTELYLKAIASEQHVILIAMDKETPAGYLSCFGQMLLHHMGMVYEIQELFVDHPYRNKGIGKQLLAHLEQLLKQLPCKSLEVTSNRKRVAAHRFYEANGFKQSHLKFTKQV